MAVNNTLGGIMAKYVIGARPAICFNEDKERFTLRTYVSEDVYKNIFDEAARCGYTVYRDSIDFFISKLLNQDDVALQYAKRIYRDNEILAGERLRLFSEESEIDLLKIRKQCYICTRGSLEGEIIVLDNVSLDSSHELRALNFQSIAFLMPGNAYTVMDYKYLKNYHNEVATDITGLYDKVCFAFQNNALEEEFQKLLDECGGLGVSIWTLMGLIDFLQIRNHLY